MFKGTERKIGGGNVNCSHPKSLYNFQFFEFKQQNVIKGLRSLSEDSICDVLQLDSRLLKSTAVFIAPFVTHLYNVALSTKQMPNDWKLARITPVYKGKGDINNEVNYRPISVISHIAKIFEREVHDQL